MKKDESEYSQTLKFVPEDKEKFPEIKISKEEIADIEQKLEAYTKTKWPHPAKYFNWSPEFAAEMEEEFGQYPPCSPERHTQCWQASFKKCMEDGTRGGEPVCSEKAFAASSREILA